MRPVPGSNHPRPVAGSRLIAHAFPAPCGGRRYLETIGVAKPEVVVVDSVPALAGACAALRDAPAAALRAYLRLHAFLSCAAHTPCS